MLKPSTSSAVGIPDTDWPLKPAFSLSALTCSLSSALASAAVIFAELWLLDDDEEDVEDVLDEPDAKLLEDSATSLSFANDLLDVVELPLSSSSSFTFST